MTAPQEGAQARLEQLQQWVPPGEGDDGGDAALARARRSISDSTKRRLQMAWDRLGGYRDKDAALFIEGAVPRVQAAQQQIGTRAAERMNRIATRQSARFNLFTIGLTDDQTTNLRGVSPYDVYRRPFVATYTALKRGEPFPDAVARGRTRLGEIVEMDMQQAYSESSRAAMQQLPPDARPQYWRRVLMGEQNCALCTLASTQRYSIETLNPVHPGCDCQVSPVFDEALDPIPDDEARVQAAHAAVRELTGRAADDGRKVDYRDVMLSTVRTHGEVGPLLVKPTDHFDGPRQVAAAA